MPTNIATVAGWVTPQSVSSSDAVTSTLWNTLASDVALLYGKPWIFAFQTANTTTTPFVSSTSGTVVGSPIFKTPTVGGSFGTLINSPASGLGSFSVTSSTGAINFPTSSGTTVPGLYRISVQLMTQQNGTNFQRPIIVVQGGSVLSFHPGPWMQSTGSPAGVYVPMVASVVIPVGYGTWASASNFYVSGQVAGGTSPNLLATDSVGNGPNSTPPVYNSWVFAEYLGTSTGTF